MTEMQAPSTGYHYIMKTEQVRAHLLARIQNDVTKTVQPSSEPALVEIGTKPV